MKWLPIIFLLSLTLPVVSQEKKWTPPPAIELSKLIGTNNELAEKKVKASWGEKGLKTGKQKWIEATTLVVGVLSDEPVSAVKDDGTLIGELTRLNDDGLYVLAKDIGNFQDVSYQLKTASGKKIGDGKIKIEHYTAPPESFRKEGIPEGALHPHRWKDSKVFPNTDREFLVYVPKQYDGSKPASLLVFQDGLRHADRDLVGGLRTPTVMDHLIASGEMPVTIGIFINPGRLADQSAGAKPKNRSLEYDGLGPDYATFLLEEIIPFVTKEHDLKLSDQPADWAIAGGSSGCAAAWTAAWERPDRFGKVLGWVGTFTDIRGANVYPSWIRKT